MFFRSVMFAVLGGSLLSVQASAADFIADRTIDEIDAAPTDILGAIAFPQASDSLSLIEALADYAASTYRDSPEADVTQHIGVKSSFARHPG